MLPRRPGARFALEALFLVLLAIGAGLADLRPLYIVIVMVGAWALVALGELSAERIDRAPLSYLQPQAAVEDDGEPREVFGWRPEERTVVAPPEQAVEASQKQRPPPEKPSEQQAVAEAPEPAAQPLVREGEALEVVAGEPEGLPDESAREEVEPEPVLSGPQLAGWGEPPDEPPAMSTEAEAPELRRPRLFRSLLRRREPEVELEPAPPPRHVKLLPRRPADEPSRASQEVAELFESRSEDDEPAQTEENTR